MHCCSKIKIASISLETLPKHDGFVYYHWKDEYKHFRTKFRFRQGLHDKWHLKCTHRNLLPVVTDSDRPEKMPFYNHVFEHKKLFDSLFTLSKTVNTAHFFLLKLFSILFLLLFFSVKTFIILNSWNNLFLAPLLFAHNSGNA